MSEDWVRTLFFHSQFFSVMCWLTLTFSPQDSLAGTSPCTSTKTTLHRKSVSLIRCYLSWLGWRPNSKRPVPRTSSFRPMPVGNVSGTSSPICRDESIKADKGIHNVQSTSHGYSTEPMANSSTTCSTVAAKPDTPSPMTSTRSAAMPWPWH